VLPYAWAEFLRYGHVPDVGYSDWFSIYPWMLDKNFEYVVMRSIGQIDLDEASELKPQSTPGITPQPLVRRMIDRPMLAALLERWPARYQTETPTWENTAIFRSLNMANAAARLPATAGETYYDIGRCIALWVSAFEILVHSGSSGLFDVYDNFDKAEWHLTKCKEKEYEAHGHKAGLPLRTLACWIYGKIHKCRNDFQHGNSITPDSLLIPGSGRFLLHYAPVLYRMALTGLLELKWDGDPPDANEELDTYEQNKLDFGYFQGDMEAALATALTPSSKVQAQTQKEGRSAN